MATLFRLKKVQSQNKQVCIYPVKINIFVKFFLLSFLIFFADNCFAQNSGKVLRVIDGQSLEIEYEGQKETIHLLGVEIPRLAPEDEIYKSKKYKKRLKKREKAAFKLMKSLVKEGDNLFIEFDERKWDKLHRFVGYVFAEDGRMLNEEIIRAGYSNVELRPPNIKYEEEFNQVLEEAKLKKRGMWK